MRSASVDAGALVVRCDWRPDAQVLDALDHGIELPFVVTASIDYAGAVNHMRRHIRLRYFPLSRQYQVSDVEDATERSYAVRALALQAMENLRLPLVSEDRVSADRAGATRLDVRITLDRDALPGALRLPALLQSAWRMDSGTWTWRARAG
ncbi:MAG: DUF4390 domain-containing protein [Proteobacteria bacterium]|nr:DUF4390 domain-containing protein [Pseudomonadota bacterium]